MTAPDALALVIEPNRICITRPGGLTLTDLRIAETIHRLLVIAGQITPGGAE